MERQHWRTQRALKDSIQSARQAAAKRRSDAADTAQAKLGADSYAARAELFRRLKRADALPQLAIWDSEHGALTTDPVVMERVLRREWRQVLSVHKDAPLDFDEFLARFDDGTSFNNLKEHHAARRRARTSMMLLRRQKFHLLAGQTDGSPLSCAGCQDGLGTLEAPC